MRDIDDYTDKYNVVGFEDYQVIFRRKKVLEQIKKYSPKHILEIGCGMEPLFKVVDNMKFTIVEPSEIFAKNAIKLAEGKEVKCICGYFEDENVLNRLNDQYDMVVCSSLLHEVEKPELLLEAIMKKCVKSTIVHINVPNANSMHRLLAKECGILKDIHEKTERNILYQQSNVFDIESLCNLTEKVGFRTMEKGDYFIKPFTHDQMYKMIEMGIMNFSILQGLYNFVKYMPGLGSEIYVNCKLDSNF